MESNPISNRIPAMGMTMAPIIQFMNESAYGQLEDTSDVCDFTFGNPHDMPLEPTIISRCQRFDLKPIPVSLIMCRLKEITSTENINIEESALNAIARAANGGMRDAQSTLDQLISFCGDNITEADVLEVYVLKRQARLT